MYPVVFFDALGVKIRDDGTVRSKAVYLALGLLPDGSRDIVGIWIEQRKAAKFPDLAGRTERAHRGLEKIT
jgi:putative transposase